MKGADIIHPRINWEDGEHETVVRHLEKFAKKGLRTLMMCKREMSAKEVDEVIDELTEIEQEGGKDKKAKLEEIYTRTEQDMTYVGGSAIEDQLQDNVSETIAKLIEAEIRVWVLTGDKQETAIEIGKLCRLVEDEFDQILLNVDRKTKKGEDIPLEECEA